MASPSDHAAGSLGSSRYARTLVERTEASADPATTLCQLAVATLRMSGAGLSLGRRDGLELVAVSDERSERIGAMEEAVGDGPCVAAFRSSARREGPDLLAGTEWPVFSHEAARSGVRAAFGFPLMAGDTCFGSMNLYRDEPGTLTDGELADAIVVGEVSGDLVLTWQAAAAAGSVAWQFRRFFDDRVAVHQAVGRISVQADVTIADAHALLRAYAFAHDRSVLGVAAEVAAGTLRLR